MKRFLSGMFMPVVTLMCSALLAGISPASAQIISTIAGNGTGAFSSDGIQATASEVHNPTTVAVDAAGNIYIADFANARVRKVSTSGIITTVAGTGIPGYNFDGVPATTAKLYQPNGVALDAAGNLYIAEMAGSRIRMVNTSGIISTIAGNGTAGITGDGSPATAALVNHPSNVAIDGAGNIYIADWGNSKIRMINTAGIISTIAGTGSGGYTGDGIATAQKLNAPYSVSLDALGNLYLSDENNDILRKITLATDMLTTIAGTAMTTGASGDGGAATAATFDHPDGIVANAGQLYIADFNNNKIRVVNLSTGIVTTAVGNGTAGFAGDGSPATDAAVKINGPAGVTLDPSGNVYIADFTNNRIRKVSIDNHAPFFDSGHVQHITMCEGTNASLDAGLAITDSDIGQTETWSLYTNAVNGNIYIGTSVVGVGTAGTGTSNGGILPITGTFVYRHTAGMPLVDSFVFRVNDGISIDSTKFIITVNTAPPVDVIGGPTSVCAGSAITLTDDSLGGTWVSTNTSSATIGSTGVLTGVTGGTIDNVLYVVSNSCGNDTAYANITVNSSPVAISPSSAVTVCIGDFFDLTDGTTGGTWSASNGNAVVSSIGHVTGVTAGADTITYAIGLCSVTKVVTVNGPVAPLPHSPTICVGNTVTLTDASGGGTWSSGGTGIATIAGSGVVTGAGAGVVAISYTVGSCSVMDTVTVISGIAAISPATATVCAGGSVTLSDASGGGIWTASNLHAGVAGGIVSGTSAGSDTITYTLGTCYSQAYITINAMPAAITPSGGVSICAGSTTLLGDVTSGGTWSSSATGTATVASGTVAGVAAGVATISYTVSGCSALKTVSVNGPVAILPYDPSICSSGGTVSLSDGVSGGSWSCAVPAIASVSVSGLVTGVGAGIAPVTYTVGSCITVDTVTVLAGPSAITPSGAVSLCARSTTVLADGVSGGTWSSSATGVATVASGTVSGIASGVATISYTIGTCVAVKTITVNGPAAIAPYDPTICAGSTVSLTDATPGGSWTSGAPAVATVTLAGGLVTGVSAGIAPITYTVGSCIAIDTVAITAGVAAITPSGGASVCTGSTTLLADATPSGTWSSSATAVATVSGGMVTGVSAGTATITYTVGSCSSTTTVTVNLTPADLSPASANICLGGTTTFTEATTGGTWSSSAPGVASVSGGLVAGLAPGTAIISYTLGTCSASAAVSVSISTGAGSITGPSSVCVGNNVTLADGVSGGLWSSATTAIATVVGSTGVVTGVSGGTATISYTISNACGTVSTSATVSVVPAGVLAIGGPSVVCAGTSATMTDGTTGGTWSSSNATAIITSGGLLTGVTPGTDTITYLVTNACGTSSTTKIINVGAFLTAGNITGATSVCAGTNITLADLAPGGVWSASNTHATVSGSTITGVSAGVDTISYTVTSSCGTAVATHMVTVNSIPVAASITGPASICLGSTATYTDATTGGVWSMSNGHATVIGTGLVIPVSVGIDTIKYTVSNACGSVSTTAGITIGAFLAAGSISGPATVCEGTPATFTDSTSGGVWSVANADAAISGTGIVTGMATGVDTISYTVSGSCGTAVATAIVSINVAPVAGSITGPTTMCTGSVTLFTDPTPGGVWSSANADATVTMGGSVTALLIGVDTIAYTITNTCGTSVAKDIITINMAPHAGVITGPTIVCLGANISLADTTAGGTWSISNANATISTSGVVTGIMSGMDTVYYTTTSLCGSISATYILAVGTAASAAPITGPTVVCVGSSITLSDTVSGGSWYIGNPNATISSGGVVTGVMPGMDTVTYVVTGPCGPGSATYIVTISTLPVAGTITGPTSVCQGDTITLADVNPGGVWTAGNANATVGSATGDVTGVTPGVDLISYTISNVCGSVFAAYSVTVNALPDPGVISGLDSVCVGANITLADAISGGAWSAGNANATVSTSGVVTGVATGTDPISYSVTNGCGTVSAVEIVFINTIPSAGSIMGGSTVCMGSGITLSDAVPGGTWSVSNAYGLMAGPGILDGVSLGIDTVYYTVAGVCGSGVATKAVTINPVPVVAAVSGPTSQCTGTVVTLTDATTGGIWSSSTPVVATIGSSSGVASGIAAGTTTITYTVTNIFGCPSSVTSMDTVSIMTTTPAITGPSDVCPGAAITLSDTLTGGTWSSSAPAIATAGSATGIVTGVASGVVTISYMVSGTCGTSFVTKAVTVDPLPTVAAIGGTAMECPGLTAALTDATAGGVWTTGNALIATVGSSTGIVTGITTGSTTVSYTVTNLFGCSASATITNTVNAAPSVAAITGIAHECLGSTAILADAAMGGTWSSSNPAMATIDGTGTVTGVAAGIVTITYSLPGSGCAGFATVADTVSTVPIPTPITGSTNVCLGGTTTLADSSFGGAWSSSNTAMATISTSGVVSGVVAGNDEIYYSVANSCGSVTDSIAIAVQVAPVAGTITGGSSVCQGAVITLADTTTGGVWSSANTKAIVSGGLVTGVAAGIDTIKYTVTNACGSALAIKPISVGGLPYDGTISGYTSVCAGLSISLTESTPGGVWNTSNTAIATVSGGVVTGITAGAVTISYSVTNSCGTRSATHAVTVVPASECHTMVNNTGSTNTEISIYPNPATDVLVINAPVKVNVQVMSIDGKVLIEQKDAVNIDVTSLADGMYMILIYDENNQLLKASKFAKLK